MTNVGILSIGMDGLTGDPADEPAHWIARTFAAAGWSVRLQMTIQPVDLEIEAAVRFALQRGCHLIILSGGRSFADNCPVCRVIARLTNRELVLHADVLAHMKEYYCTRIKDGLQDYTDIDATRRVESTIPLGVELFYRDSTGLPAFMVPFETAMVLSLPDRSDEMRIVVTEIMAHRLKELRGSKTPRHSREVRTSFREPALLSMLVTMLRVHCPDITAEIRAGDRNDGGYLTLRLTVSDEMTSETTQELDKATAIIYRGLESIQA